MIWNGPCIIASRLLVHCMGHTHVAHTSGKYTNEYTQKRTMSLKPPTRMLCLVAMASVCLLACSSNAGEISATPTDSEVITISKEKYDTMVSKKDVLQHEIARLQSMLKSRKHFAEECYQYSLQT